MVRYADDFVCCFQYEDDANRSYNALQNRLGKFNLSIAVEKTKIISFGRSLKKIVPSRARRSQIRLTS